MTYRPGTLKRMIKIDLPAAANVRDRFERRRFGTPMCGADLERPCAREAKAAGCTTTRLPRLHRGEELMSGGDPRSAGAPGSRRRARARLVSGGHPGRRARHSGWAWSIASSFRCRRRSCGPCPAGSSPRSTCSRARFPADVRARRWAASGPWVTIVGVTGRRPCCNQFRLPAGRDRDLGRPASRPPPLVLIYPPPIS